MMKKVFATTIKINEVINKFNLIGTTKIIMNGINKKLPNARVLLIWMRTIIIINTDIIEVISNNPRMDTPGLLKIAT